MKDELKWGWMLSAEDHAHGPFESREDAIGAARDGVSSARIDFPLEVEIGRCAPIDPRIWIPDDLDDLLNEMDRCACDDGGVDTDDMIFEVDDEGGARAALTEFMQEFARKWIHSKTWLLEQTETITLEREEADDD